MRNKKDHYFIIPNKQNLVLDTQDVNDPNLEIILEILKDYLECFEVYYGDGDVITLTWK